MEVTIRPATEHDAEQIGRFQTLTWDRAYRGLVPDHYLDGMTWQLRAERWLDRITTGSRSIWVAHSSGALVGVASTTVTPADWPGLPEVELSSIYVDRSAHGQGVSRLLLDSAIGDRPAHLWVFEQNDRAQRFYAKHGFAATGEQRADPDTGVLEVRWLRR